MKAKQQRLCISDLKKRKKKTALEITELVTNSMTVPLPLRLVFPRHVQVQ